MDIIGFDRGFVSFIASDVEQSTVDFGMKCLDPSIEHFWKTCERAQVCDGNSCFPEALGGTPGGDESDPGIDEGLGERNQTGFIRNRKQCAMNFGHN